LRLATVVACGPSFQAIYDGDARFEHCYALEETATVSLQERGECWRDWSVRYTFGQTRDRVEYAKARARALALAQLPTDEAMMQAAPNEVATGTSVTAPGPTNAFAPPPKTYGQSDGGAEIPRRSALLQPPPPSAPPDAPAAACATGCLDAFRACKAQCATQSCDCEPPYRRCMRGCFQDEVTPGRPSHPPRAKAAPR
jgi:hypothetical protein